MKIVFRCIASAILLAGGASLCLAQGSHKQDANQRQFRKLVTAYGAAQSDYFKPYQLAKTSEEQQKIHLDPKKNPALLYLPKFTALAQKAGKSDTAFDAYSMALQCGMGANDVRAEAKIMDILVKGFLNSPKFPSILYALDNMRYQMQDPAGKKRIDGWLAKIDQSTNPELRAAALYKKADAAYADGNGDQKAAKALYEKLMTRYPKSQYASQAKSQVFELEHLGIGMPAPDFTAEDQDGVQFKLSDYRGKVVLLDFWGFW